MTIQRTTRGYTIRGLSKNDLSALTTILARVGGDPTGPRGVANRVLVAAEKVGVRWEVEEAKWAIHGFCMIRSR